MFLFGCDWLDYHIQNSPTNSGETVIFSGITETDSNGNEVEISRVPGFLKSDKHPDGLCTPCCFQDWNSKMQVNRRKEFS